MDQNLTAKTLHTGKKVLPPYFCANLPLVLQLKNSGYDDTLIALQGASVIDLEGSSRFGSLRPACPDELLGVVSHALACAYDPFGWIIKELAAISCST
jgi:hypothetical protein